MENVHFANNQNMNNYFKTIFNGKMLKNQRKEL